MLNNFETRTVGGHEYRVYATDGEGEYCIHGAAKISIGWMWMNWNIHGETPRYSNEYNLIPIKRRRYKTLQELCEEGAVFIFVKEGRKYARCYNDTGTAYRCTARLDLLGTETITEDSKVLTVEIK